jgi:excisionase family DNA binding protein
VDSKSKVHQIRPIETGPETNGADMLVTLRVADLREIIRGELKAVLAAQRPPVAKMAFTIREAAEMLSVPPTWLAAKARAGEIPTTRQGHYVTFAEQDLKDFIAKMRNTT